LWNTIGKNNFIPRVEENTNKKIDFEFILETVAEDNKNKDCSSI
jgi:hypothetical protein